MNSPADEAIVLGQFGDSDWASVCTNCNWVVKLSAGDTGSDFVALLRATLETGCN
jgi:hypothetical protein